MIQWIERVLRSLPSCVFCVFLATGAGCAGPKLEPLPQQQHNRFRAMAIKTLEDAAFGDSPTLRMQAIEAFKEVAPIEGMERLAIPLNIENDYPGASFAALMAIGEARPKDLISERLLDAIRTRAESQNKLVRMAAIFALHRLGDPSRTSELSLLLLDDPDARIRANAALVIGRLGGKEHIKLLRVALNREKKSAAKLQILESLAVMEDEHAIRRLIFHGYSKYADQATLALMMLAGTKSQEAEELFWHRFRMDSDFPEIRLQAARGLAALGHDEGRNLALKHLFFSSPKHVTKDDPTHRQVERVRALAALALEAIADPEVLGTLKQAFETQGQSEYVRIAVARAAIRTIDRSGHVASSGKTKPRQDSWQRSPLAGRSPD
ncbi:MAG: HEAT repeat domain-containing protein [Phycisphaerales bacterium]|nr:HEAT repeat domain-containing protein [Phycisphaerales bacterium]